MFSWCIWSNGMHACQRWPALCLNCICGEYVRAWLVGWQRCLPAVHRFTYLWSLFCAWGVNVSFHCDLSVVSWWWMWTFCRQVCSWLSSLVVFRGSMRRTWRRRGADRVRVEVPMMAGKRKVDEVLPWFDWEFWHGVIAFKFRRLLSWSGVVNDAEPANMDIEPWAYNSF